MIELKGKYNKAKVFTENIESGAISQVIELCNQEFVKDSKIRVMPDVHAGAGCTIGTTMTIKDTVVPNLVGVDIGCGMHVTKLKVKEVDLEKLDKTINKLIPAGFNVRDSVHRFSDKVDFEGLKCLKRINIERAKNSIGTLGGGNHFIEVNRDENGSLYLVIHSGSRYLGKQVAELYQNKAIDNLMNTEEEVKALIEKLKAEGREKEISKKIKEIKPPKIRKELAYLQGEDLKDYLNDMSIVQSYAVWNRKAIADEILCKMGIETEREFTTIHNYIDVEDMILRKGAISAKDGEEVLIPINMKEGSLLAVGKGNPDWNYSAPHGAGRLMSRRKAKETISMEDYKETMKDIYSTSVCESTLDEAPDAYKSIEEIIENTKDAIEIKHIIKPIYNFKSK